MKKFLGFLVFIFTFTFFPALALAGELDHFDVKFSRDSAKVAEGLDVTITAMDSNNQVVMDYVGDIIVFSETDSEAEFPAELKKSYSFKESDQGKIKFENAVKYTKKGKHDLQVYDLQDDSKFGFAEIEVGDSGAKSDSGIKILSPENNITLGEGKVDISGMTQKNHQVKIVVNAKDDFMAASDNDGMFKKTIEGLQDGENTFQAFLLDANQKTISESGKVSVKINSSKPEFKSIKFLPSNTAVVESPLDVEVVATPKLSKVQIIINDVLTALDEKKDGVYTGKVYMPAKEGKYPVDVHLQNEFGHKVDKKNATSLEVTPLLNSASNNEPVNEEPKKIEEPEDPKVIEEIKEKYVPRELDLDITGIKVTELKDRSIVTWNVAKDAVSYNIYKKVGDEKYELVNNVKKPRFEVEIVGKEIKYDYFKIRAVGKTEEGEEVNGNFSDMTKVKTGPEMIIFGLIALLIGAGIIFFQFKRRRA